MGTIGIEIVAFFRISVLNVYNKKQGSQNKKNESANFDI